MYNSRSNLLIGFYVWEYNFKRAKQWAENKKEKGKIKNPAVVGVVFQLDHCLDFTDSEYIDLLSSYYEQMKKDFIKTGQELPKKKIFLKTKIMI